MREWLKSLYIAGASLVKKPKPGVYILNGHYLSRQANNDPLVFERLLTSLSQFARFVSIQSAVDLVLSGDASNQTETLIAFTFDDGFDDNFLALAPALKRFGTNACCFVNPGFIDGDSDYIEHFTQHRVKTPAKKPMSWQQVKSLFEEGFVIGNHTMDHVRLSEVSLQDAERQVCLGKDRIEQEVGAPCDYFAWPYGQYADVTESVIDMLLKHHSFVFSGCDYTRYTSFNGRVLNRRHFEADWPHHQVRYFLSSMREA